MRFPRFELGTHRQHSAQLFPNLLPGWDGPRTKKSLEEKPKMIITKVVARTVRVLERQRDKMQKELETANSVLAVLNPHTAATTKAHMAAGTKAKIGKAVRAAWKAKRKA